MGGIAASAIERAAVSDGGMVCGTWSDPTAAPKIASRRSGSVSASRTASVKSRLTSSADV
eukprot:7387416-Prorocentrum_lima.AAC.1